MISGVKKTDTIEFVSDTGIASFAEETQNKGVGAFIGVVAAGATVAASAFGAPELAPVIGSPASSPRRSSRRRRSRRSAGSIRR